MRISCNKKREVAAERDTNSSIDISFITYASFGLENPKGERLMDSIFGVDEVERSHILQFFFELFGCTYVCIWSYLSHPSNKCLIFKDGLLMEARNNNMLGSSSSESIARRLFTEYKQSTINIDNDVDGFVPGFAFKNNNPFLELNEFDLQGFASLEVQRRFYKEANIKRAIFMGCNGGEIELGFGNVSHVNLEMELRKWFPDDFSRQVHLKENDQNSVMAFQDPQVSSSSSSLKSLSIESPETSAFYNNITQAFRPTTTMPPSSSRLVSTDIPFYQSAMQPFGLLPSSHFPLVNTENDVMTSAILAVLSASATSTLPHFSTSYLDPLATLEVSSTSRSNRISAFRSYSSTNLPSSSTKGQITQNPNRVSVFRRIVSYTFKRLQELHMLSGGICKTPSSSQLHHMISERKRRVKMNESFDILRALLPPGTKKHKALVLNGAIDYLTSLQSQVAGLSLRNLRLEAQLLPRTETQQDKSSSTSAETRSDDIQINTVSESTSNGDRLVDVRVTVQGEISLLSAVSRFLEFLRGVNGLSLMSMEAETLLPTDSSTPSNYIFSRLRIQGSVWDESAFGEALRKIVSDVAPSQA